MSAIMGAGGGGTTAGGGSQSIGISNLGNTGGTSGIASGSAVQFLLAGGSNISLSQSISGASGTVTINGPAQATLTQFVNGFGSATSGAAPGNGTLAFFPLVMPNHLIADRAVMIGSATINSSSNSSFAAALSLRLGIYSKSGSTLSLLSSGLGSYQFSNTSDSSISLISGQRLLTIPINITASPGNYYVGFVHNSSFTNANWITMSYARWLIPAMSLSGHFGSSLGADHLILGQGLYSASTNALPSSLPFTDILSNTAGSIVNPFIEFLNGTV